MLGARQYLHLLCWWMIEGRTGHLSTEHSLGVFVQFPCGGLLCSFVDGLTVCESVCVALEADSSEHAAEERAQNVATLGLGMQPQFHASSAAQLWTKYLVILAHSVLIDPEVCLSCRRASRQACHAT